MTIKPLPLPLRVAAGLAVTALEQARRLPQQLAGLPVTVASQALQLSMRVQQQVTELAIKGDEALAALRPVEDEPEWATFDEDLERGGGPDAGGAGGVRAADRAAPDEESEASPWSEEPTAALDEELLDTELADEIDETRGTPAPDETADETAEAGADSEAVAGAEIRRAASAPAPEEPPLADYDGMTVAQVRARLRHLSADDVAALLAYERAHADRPQFAEMLANRLAKVRGE
ncbi:hypothetical protein LX15_002618 [Streptoalloteichus tenebrarius]|uniref:DUF8129 domain-containing protein n=1 Tax=Streptoalloteichus tenebrarius (strain ATCC 17920 / DSM 40477 / JCM 4838 / CBS 697.72 / NBRC 16177 / NCIMB 11028 / NRRL B-12390 / A12253. 1 / ISP 5477) TaxID=1933 RepID=A0ABT1HTS8_STRSD|nr:lipid droplet-associated protein [Streptoalloteichus tenebrarius]MCP2258919.1 hypothetical protein [Streptoalloteichus tenebrarius]BFF01126.1 lipid droplet-associated protein [Streptoalloteichus tenebrarius]